MLDFFKTWIIIIFWGAIIYFSFMALYKVDFDPTWTSYWMLGTLTVLFNVQFGKS